MLGELAFRIGTGICPLQAVLAQIALISRKKRHTAPRP